MTSKLITYVALLRGINVGGNTLIKMAELKVCFEKLGYSNVQTYINSGNVIFQTDTKDPRALEKKIEKALVDTFGYEVAVVVRSQDEMRQLIDQIPRSWQTNINQKCNVIFLRHTIDSPDLLTQLKPKPDIEELHYRPGVLFWSAKTSDLTKSSMIKLNRLGIYKEMTIRILNTTRKIYELMQSAKSS